MRSRAYCSFAYSDSKFVASGSNGVTWRVQALQGGLLRMAQKAND